MDPVTILLALASFGSVLVVAIVVITFKRIAEWFRSRGKVKESNRNIIAFALADRINNKQFVEIGGVFTKSNASTRLIQGFYDQGTNTLLDARALASNKVEADVAQHLLDGDGLVIYS
jgi:hypothetical protein